jgi:hypothetical protein
MSDSTPGDETTEDLIEGTRQAKEAAQAAVEEEKEDAEELQADLDERARDT